MAIDSSGPRKIRQIFLDHDIHLTPLEAKLLDAVLGRQRLVTHREIIEKIWPRRRRRPADGSTRIKRCRL